MTLCLSVAPVYYGYPDFAIDNPHCSVGNQQKADAQKIGASDRSRVFTGLS